jgi:hypothetical protein
MPQSMIVIRIIGHVRGNVDYPFMSHSTIRGQKEKEKQKEK